ncbi:Molybdopterin/thiamine biosynthesis adenylyltransferase [Bosea sp. 62]|uniref:HesA/MoeB/ThiF family protein n=1 Tax=unclassified Bosea (in: a-proteobacteria) TaxID=2653178 RepID=UPI00125432D3|nr:MULTISPECIES: HesA/MoeB/ThiF family protein [unclassified Bosea (in: a-proteobacteria)]CAD5287358.1 Molybdopterin/thiamine biosynthesis adenylyltransferase [Bosea sp. 21B]CAD5289698.1 Molybdopterin/thiamine biosynthesis adenylyltransferase [Bosea sp. 46]CAD5301088.1 Molybdopterin/thiamine biosynthesis adenylyltransferase [Bosea sp. 7B]VVT60473.1 Molybdopterin or thiamine biosynthesis adenylyltransferase [Bosea sp. EC-HK365B]VXB01622.1 Molybdopterin/thiamine biosynthesis adenylyltransferase 
MTDRYARQIVMPEIGPEGQARLARASVLVVGAGGLGCPVLQYLAGAGIGRLLLVDPDRVEESNLHRQPLYRMSEVGRPKVEAAREALAAYNPGVEIEALALRLAPDNVAELVAQADIVVDAADSFAATYVLSDACYDAGKSLVSASIVGLAGYVGAFCGGGPSYRAVFPEMPARAADCATAGVLGPAVATLGLLQAQMALLLALGLEPSPLGRVISFDARRLGFGGFSFAGAPEPVAGSFPFIAPSQLSASDIVVELRGVEEAPVPAAPGAIRLTVDEIDRLSLDEADGRRVVLCCRSGIRAARAAGRLATRGAGDLALMALG